MGNTSSSNKKIASNAAFLYIRMIFIMGVSLYTSRIILNVLGVDDFGIYQVVGGLVALITALNGALSNGTSRFLTYEIGKGGSAMQRTFSTALSIHMGLAIIAIILSETIGLWFVYHKLQIAPERLSAAVWAYHFSILTVVISIIQVPYSAMVIAHEKMNAYAGIGIFEVVSKLAIVFLLKAFSCDYLILYAIFIAIVGLSCLGIYISYCSRKFQGTKYDFSIDRKIFRSIASFSSWNILSSFSIALNNQGTTIITNMFFGPAVVAARAISIQVNMAAMQFANNFRAAFHPQIVKRYAMGDYDSSQKLLLVSTKYSFYLMYIIGLPLIFLINPILKLWLGIVPEYTAVFVQLIIIQSLFSIFDISFYTALYAKGELKESVIISSVIGFIRFPVVYICFKHGASPLALSYAGIITEIILGVFVKPYLIHKNVNYPIKAIINVFTDCFKVCAISLPLPILFFYFSKNTLTDYFLVGAISIATVFLTIWFVGIDRSIRRQIIQFAITKIKHQ